MQKIIFEKWASDALRALDGCGILKKYRGSFSIENIEGLVYLCIKDEQGELGLYDVMMAWRDGMETGFAKAAYLAGKP